MKTLKTLLLVLALSGSCANGFSANNHDKGPDLRNKIRSVLSTPKCLKNNSTAEKVTVHFVVNAEGKVIEASAKTNNAEVKQHLEKQFLTMTLEGLTPCVTNTVDVNFTTY